MDYVVREEVFLQHLTIFWDFQNLQRAKLEPSLAFLVFKSCVLFLLRLFLFKVCEQNWFPHKDAPMSEKYHNCIS